MIAVVGEYVAPAAPTNNPPEAFYTPIQYYYDIVQYYKKVLDTTIEVHNTFGIHNV